MPTRVPARDMQLRTRPALQLAHKLVFAIAGTMILVLGVTWFVVSFSVENLLTEHAGNYGRTLATLTANSAAESLLADDRLQMALLVNTITKDSGIRGAAIYRRDGTRIVHNGESPIQSLPQLQTLVAREHVRANAGAVLFATNVVFNDTLVGYLQLTLDRNALEKPVRLSVRKIGIITVVMIALAVLAAYWLGRRIAKPIDRLAIATRALREGRYDLLIDERRDDEIGEIIHALNDMAQSLQRKLHAEKTLSRFVSPAIAQQIMSSDAAIMHGRRVRGTVLFVDMVGFTTISERLTPERVAALLNRYFALLNRAVKLYNGNVDKYIGDGAMVVFGATQADEDHCFHALACAHLFLQLTHAVNAKRAAWQPSVEFRGGVHTGEMIAGSMGSDDRMQFTVVGDSVNMAARLCETSQAGQVWFSQEVLHERDIRQRIEAAPEGALTLKGKTRETLCYRLEKLQSPFDQLLQRQMQHLLAQLEGTA